VLPRTLRLTPRGRRRIVLLLVLAAALAAGYWFWLRDSSLVRVEKVTIDGISTADGPRIRAKLTETARTMTTLHVNAHALRSAVADEPVVHSLSVHADFPHGLRIEIVQNRPVALLMAGTEQVPVAPDGTVLEGAKISRRSASAPCPAACACPTGRRRRGLRSPPPRHRDCCRASTRSRSSTGVAPWPC
jgi:cell division septal protein FtsQ